MKNDPWRFNCQLSTTFRRGVKGLKTQKSRPFCPKLTYTSPGKNVRSYESHDFSTFHFFQKFEKIIHRKSDSP